MLRRFDIKIWSSYIKNKQWLVHNLETGMAALP